jgi:hypothetical protein
MWGAFVIAQVLPWLWQAAADANPEVQQQAFAALATFPLDLLLDPFGGPEGQRRLHRIDCLQEPSVLPLFEPSIYIVTC